MRIRYERSGGFANIGLNLQLDSEKLAADKAQELKRLIDDARVFDQPAKPNVPSRAPDEYQYELTIEEGNRTHTIETTDTAGSPELLSLFDWLNREALAELKQRVKKP